MPLWVFARGFTTSSFRRPRHRIDYRLAAFGVGSRESGRRKLAASIGSRLTVIHGRGPARWTIQAVSGWASEGLGPSRIGRFGGATLADGSAIASGSGYIPEHSATTSTVRRDALPLTHFSKDRRPTHSHRHREAR